MFDVIVIGGGIVGVSTAYSLVSAGAKVLLIDRKDVGRATDAGAGIISPIPYNGESHPVYGFMADAFFYYDELIKDLNKNSVGDTGFARCGKLVVAATPDELDGYEATKAAVLSYQRTYGSDEDLKIITSEEAKDLFPPLTDMLGAIYYRNAARVDGRLLAAAVKVRAQQLGLLVRNDAVSRLILDGKKVKGVVASQESIYADHVVISGGAWSDSFEEQLGVHIPVAPQKGQIIHLDTGETDTSSWPIVTAFHDHYMVPWPDNRVVVGATRETDSGYDVKYTAGGVHETLGEALRVAPGLRDASIREIRVGLRPLSADYHPVIGDVSGFEGLFVVTGHGPSGLHLGPYSGQLIADVITGKAVQTDISMFHMNRFQ